MIPLKYALSGLLGVLLLAAVAPGTARADGVCWHVPQSDTILKQGSSSVLLWQADGDLALYATDNMAQPLWHSDTAGTAFELCSSTDGGLAVHNEDGATLWSKAGNSVVTGAYLDLTDCTLAAKVQITAGTFKFTSTLWSIAGTCPNTASQTTTLNGWCADTSSEQTIVQSDWAKLVWKTSGNLVLSATGIDDGTTLWSSSTAGSELCFEDTGELVIYNASSTRLWGSGATGSDDVAYTLGLKGCSLNVTAFTGGTLWSSANTCPQTWNNSSWTVYKGTSDKTLVENDAAELVFTTTGALTLRSKAGKQFWTSNTSGTGNRLVFQSDGNLVIYPTSGGAVWSSGTAGQSATQIKIDGCSFSLTNGGSTTYYSRGSSSCTSTSARSLDGTTITRSGNTRILQTEEAYLEWESTGNLVLHSMGGSTLWNSGTSGTGKKLSLQSDGNLVIYNSAGAAVWASGTSGMSADTINLGDDCAFTVKDGSTTRWTGNSSCAVMSYAYENSQGNSTFGVVMSTALTAENLGIPEVLSTNGLDLTLFGNKTALLQATAYQTSSNSGASLETGSIEILGNSMDYGVNVSYEKEFWSKSKTFMVGVVPVAVTASATGTIGLSLSYNTGGTLTLTPAADLSATVQAGVGVGSDEAGASAGVRGSLTLISLGLPINLKIFSSGGQWKFTVSGDLTLETLSGSLALYAEAYIKVWGLKVGASWSYKLFGWTGLSLTKNLFSKTASF
jgi:hypothetical protein